MRRVGAKNPIPRRGVTRDERMRKQRLELMKKGKEKRLQHQYKQKKK